MTVERADELRQELAGLFRVLAERAAADDIGGVRQAGRDASAIAREFASSESDVDAEQHEALHRVASWLSIACRSIARGLSEKRPSLVRQGADAAEKAAAEARRLATLTGAAR